MNKKHTKINKISAGELIKELKKYPPETRVVIPGYEGGYDDIKELKEISLVLDCYIPDYYGRHEEKSEYESRIGSIGTFYETVRPEDKIGGIVKALILSGPKRYNI
ncbi:MAG: hypothetical protein EVG15_02515 [Candidatus Acididesulfobacter diazotrophicus]|jgi:hypothetical protein|uniref:Uncharacterized protein n=1 Tax=Candidatus Acididesulfobacter diazotrophicus TaxID=2597226 RepID=A0A519BNZ7_9DELT|nr:MAG: hypothetical protein EVG15_02515 [Candidatus Acididesulfobacter diazotrophicus]